MTIQLTVLKPPEARSSAPVTREAANSQNTWPPGRRLSRKELRDPKSRLVGRASRLTSSLLALLYAPALLRFSISMKPSYSSSPASSLPLKPYKELKLAVSSGALPQSQQPLLAS